MSEPYAPLYRKLFERYKEEILKFRLRPGQRVFSIAQLQRKHGVARETAKRVLNLLAEEGYIVKLQGKGSFVADLRPKQQIWGLVFPFFSVQYEELIVEVSRRARGRGRELRYFCDYNSYEEELRLVAMMLQERYEGVVVIPTMDESRTWEFYSRISPLESPVVLLDHTMTSNDFPFVVQSYDLGVVRAVTYLLDRTDGGLAFIENEVWAGRNMVLELMRETYLDLMRRKRPGRDPLVLRRADLASIDTLIARGVSGLFCCDDICAIQAIGRLKQRGAEVPRDCHVVSYGNTDLSRFFTPAISSVDPHNAEMADLLSQVLSSDTGQPLVQHVVQPELVVRET